MFAFYFYFYENTENTKNTKFRGQKQFLENTKKVFFVFLKTVFNNYFKK